MIRFYLALSLLFFNTSIVFSQIFVESTVLVKSNIAYKKLLYNEEFFELQNHFRRYQLLEGIKIINHLDRKLDDTSFEKGYLTYYKGFFDIFIDDPQDFHLEVENLQKIIEDIKDPDDKIILTCYLKILKIYEVENAGNLNKMYDISKEIYQEVDHMKVKNQFFYLLKGKAARNLAEMSVTKKQFVEAKKYIEISKHYYDFLEDNYLRAAYYRTLGLIEMEEIPKNPAKAYNHYLTMLDYAYKSKATFEAYNLYPMISVAALDLGKTKESSKFLLKFKMTNDTVQKNRTQAINYIKELKEKKLSQQKWVDLSIVILIVILSGIFIYLLTKRKYNNLPAPKLIEIENPNQKDVLSPLEIEDLILLSKKNENAFYVKFTELYPVLYHQLCNFSPKISETEIKFCMYIKMNYSTKEIAQYTNSTVKSVESKKYRLRKKMNSTPEEDLYSFINKL